MNKVQNGLPINDTAFSSVEFAPKTAYGRETVADCESRENADMDNETEMSGHTLLSRRQAPQGRRSLFRR